MFLLIVAHPGNLRQRAVKWLLLLLLFIFCDVCLDICHQVLDLYSKTRHPQKEVEEQLSSSARAPAAVAAADDSQSRLTPKTPQTPKSVCCSVFPPVVMIGDCLFVEPQNLCVIPS